MKRTKINVPLGASTTFASEWHNISIDVPPYNHSIPHIWENGFTISLEESNGEVILRANKAGLISLARHLLMLAQDDYPIGSHIHLDDSNSLEDGSTPFVIDKIDG